MKIKFIQIVIILFLVNIGALANANELTREIAKQKLTQRGWEYVSIKVDAHKSKDDGKKLYGKNLVYSSKYDSDGNYREHNENTEPNENLINYFLGKQYDSYSREFFLYYGKVIDVEVTGVRRSSSSDGIRVAEYLLTLEPNEIGELFIGPRKLPVYIEYQLYDDGWRFEKILWNEIQSTSQWAKNYLYGFRGQLGLNNALLWQMHEHDSYTSKMAELLEPLEKSDIPSYLDTVAWVYKDHGEPDKAIEIYEKKILPKIKAQQDIQRLNNYEQNYSELKKSINDDQFFYKYTLYSDTIRKLKKSYLKHDRHRAFAYSKNSAWGWSTKRSDLTSAKEQALKNCKKYINPGDPPCKVIHYDDHWVPVEAPEKVKPDPITLPDENWNEFPKENISLESDEIKSDYSYVCEESDKETGNTNDRGLLYYKGKSLLQFSSSGCDAEVGVYLYPRDMKIIRLDSEKGTYYTVIQDLNQNISRSTKVSGQSGAYGVDLVIKNNKNQVITIVGTGEVNDNIAFYNNGKVRYWKHAENGDYRLKRFGCSYTRQVYDYTWVTPNRFDIRYEMYPLAKVYGYEDYPCHKKYGTHLEVASIFVKSNNLDTHYWKHDYEDAVAWYEKSKQYKDNNKPTVEISDENTQQTLTQLANCKPKENHSALVINLSAQTDKSNFVDTVGMFGGEFLMLSDETLESGLENGELKLLDKSIQVSIGDLETRKTIHQEKINGIFNYELPESLSEVGLKISGVTGEVESNWSDAQKISLKKGQCKIFNLVASEQFVSKLDKIKEDHNKQKEKQQEKTEEKRKRKQDELEAKLAEEQARQQAASLFAQYIGPIRAKVTNSWIRPGSYKSGARAKILVRVSPQGDVMTARIQDGSGDPVFDRSAINAIYKASPLPIPDDERLYPHYRDFVFNFDPPG